MGEMSKHHNNELIIDPQSNDYSGSRLSLLWLVGPIPVMVIMDWIGYKFSAWMQYTDIVKSVAAIYLVNSGLRVWRDKVIDRDHKEG